MENLKIKVNYKSVPERQPGAKWHTNRSGEFEIIGKLDDHTGKYYLIKFLNTGYQMIASGSAFKTGTIKDPMARLALGVGYIGVGKYKTSEKGKETKWGTLWFNMLQRCYSAEYQERTPTYKGCKVCERWQCFQYFCEDIEKLPGYKEWLINSNYALDKDTKIPGNKIYSPETCQFIYNGDNTKASNRSKNIYKGIDPSGNIFYFRNQRRFAETHNMTKEGISSVVRGAQFTHRGWTFKKLTLEEIKEIKSEIIQD